MKFRAIISCLYILGSMVPNFCEADANATGSSGGCMYKGIRFAHGKTWVSINSFRCGCNPAGRYHCMESGITFADLPGICKFFNHTDACCATPNCYFMFTWGDTTERATLMTTMDGISGAVGNACVNKVSNCATHGKNICTDPDYASWSKEFCCAYCNSGPPDLPIGLFPSGPDTLVGRAVLTKDSQSTRTGCRDAIHNCHDYGRSVCDDPKWASWVNDHCQGFCNKCSDPPQGTCDYAGQTYVENEHWADTCVAQCTCLDGTTGEYTCSYPCAHSKEPADCHMSPNCPTGFNVPAPVHWLWRDTDGPASMTGLLTVTDSALNI